MNLIVAREPSVSNMVRTLGRMYINDKQFCFTVEDCDRHLEDNPDGKIYGETAIPRGEYDVIISFSQRFKRELPEVLGVPGFVGIRIHSGNTASDTHGCILVGSNRTFEGVGNSRATMGLLMAQMEASLDRGEKIKLAVI